MMINKLEEIMDEVEAGLKKLDKGDIWTANSKSISILFVSIALFIASLIGFAIDLYYFLKFKIYWRLKFKKLLK